MLLGVLLLVLPAAAQLKFGEFSSNLNGNLSAGYTGDYGNQIDSDHSLAFGGSGTLSGFYYNPNFISFTVSPYMNQARDNSTFQSISNASGVNFSSTIFGGSHFPGSINYAKAYNSEGNFAVPGLANYTTHGDSQSFGVNWAELVPGLPTLSATFQMGSSQYSIYGENDNGTTSNRSFSLRSGYVLKGFSLGAFFGIGSGHSEVPQVLQDSSSEQSSSTSRNFGLTAAHSLPLNGNFSSSFTNTHYDSDFAGGSNNGSIDTYNASALFQPTQKFHFSVSTDYSSNLSGSLSEAIAGPGGVAPQLDLGQGTHAFDLLASASYSVMANMQALAFADHREQYYLDESYGSSSYGGGITYWRLLFGGNLNTAVTLSDNNSSTSNANSLGLNTSVNYNRRYDGWAMGVSAGYSQNVQSQLITYTTSSYSYGASLRRRFRKFGWSGSGGVTKTLLTEIAGSSSTSESFSTSINYSHWFTGNANYSKASGSAIEAGAGLIQNPVPQPIVPGDDLILFGGKSYSFGVSSNPMRRLTFGASYSKSITNSDLAGVLSSSNTKMINATFNYQFRKMYLNGGYSNLVQGFSVTGTLPENVSSFYMGVTRWFNFF